MKNNINEMKDWEILQYLRHNRKWMVQSHYSKEDIENFMGKTMDEKEWLNFTTFACDSFDYSKEALMETIISNYRKE